MQGKYIPKLSGLLAAVLLAVSLSIGTIAVNAANINDLDKSSAYAREAIQSLASNNIISGDTKGNFNPRKTISRAELVTLLVKALEIDTSNLPLVATFKDVPTNHWSFKYVEAAYRAGIVSGIGNGKFGVNNLCTREQITTMLMNYFSVSKEAVLADQGLAELEKFEDKEKMSDWAKPSIQFAISNQLMSGTSSDLFSPDGSATKEQTAVVLYKLLNSKETIQQNADALRSLLITYNGDILKPAVAPEIENNEVLVPLEVIKAIGAEVNFDELMNKVTILSSTTVGRNLYVNVGNQTAYKNYTGSGDPYNDPAAQENIIELNTAPKKVGNEVLVPIKAVTDVLGLQMDWNMKTNLVVINDSNAVKNPSVFKALQSMLEYKGEYRTGMSLVMKENISNEDFNLSYTMNGAINGENSTAKSTLSLMMTGIPEESYEYDTVKIGDAIYSKDMETNQWSLLNQTEADELGILYHDVKADKKETQLLLDSYEDINIKYLGKAVIGSEEVSKYEVVLSDNILEQFIPEDFIESGVGINDIYNKGLEYTTEIYLNNQGQLVKQVIEGRGGMEYDGYDIDLIISVYSELINIGKDIQIVNPI